MPDQEIEVVSKEWLLAELRKLNNLDTKSSTSSNESIHNNTSIIILDCRTSNDYLINHIRNSVNFSIPTIMLRRLASGKIDIFQTIKNVELKKFIIENYNKTIFILYNDNYKKLIINNNLNQTNLQHRPNQITYNDYEGGNDGSTNKCITNTNTCTTRTTNTNELTLAATNDQQQDATINVLHRKLKQDGCRVVLLEGGFSEFHDTFPEWCEDNSNIDILEQQHKHLQSIDQSEHHSLQQEHLHQQQETVTSNNEIINFSQNQQQQQNNDNYKKLQLINSIGIGGQHLIIENNFNNLLPQTKQQNHQQKLGATEQLMGLRSLCISTPYSDSACSSSTESSSDCESSQQHQNNHQKHQMHQTGLHTGTATSTYHHSVSTPQHNHYHHPYHHPSHVTQQQQQQQLPPPSQHYVYHMQVQQQQQQMDAAPIEILPGLFLGNATHSSDSLGLQKYNIRYILNVTPDLPNVFENTEGMKYLKIPITDHWSQDLAGHFPTAIKFIDEARSKGSSVLVHCLAGVSRSVTITLAYLMHSNLLNLNDAFSLVRARKPDVSPNFHFLEQLHRFEIKLKLDQQHTPLSSTSSSSGGSSGSGCCSSSSGSGVSSAASLTSNGSSSLLLSSTNQNIANTTNKCNNINCNCNATNMDLTHEYQQQKQQLVPQSLIHQRLNKYSCSCIQFDCKCMMAPVMIATQSQQQQQFHQQLQQKNKQHIHQQNQETQINTIGVSPDSGIEFDRWTPLTTDLPTNINSNSLILSNCNNISTTTYCSCCCYNLNEKCNCNIDNSSNCCDKQQQNKNQVTNEQEEIIITSNNSTNNVNTTDGSIIH